VVITMCNLLPALGVPYCLDESFSFTMLKMNRNFCFSTSPPMWRQCFLRCKQASSWATTLLLQFMYGGERIQALCS